MIFRIALLTACLATGAMVMAQSLVPLVAVQAEQEQRIVRATQPAPLRASPPKSGARAYGEELGKTTPGASYIVIDSTQVQRLFVTDVWVRVQSVVEDAAPQVGWVYWGDVPNGPSPNFDRTDG